MSWIWTSWGSGNDPGANNETEGVRTIEQWKKDRISELTRISRERELTAEEQTERQALREEYLASWREIVIGTLENTYLVDEKGNKTKLPKKKK